MRVLVDTNVLIDVLAQRAPFYAASAEVWALAETGRIDAVVAAVSFTNVHYLLAKQFGQSVADGAVRSLRRVFGVVPVDVAAIDDAIASGRPDFEDAVQTACGLRHGATHVVTRDPRGFARSGLVVFTPAQLVAAAGGGSPR